MPSMMSPSLGRMFGEWILSPILMLPQTVPPRWERPTTSLVFTSSPWLKAASERILVARTRPCPPTPAMMMLIFSIAYASFLDDLMAPTGQTCEQTLHPTHIVGSMEDFSPSM